MARKTPFANILEWLNVSIPAFADKADEVPRNRNKALWLKLHDTGKPYKESKLLGPRNIGEYSSGQRTFPRDPVMQERIYETIIWFFEKKYEELTEENYTQLTIQFIRNLSASYPLEPEIFRYAMYIEMIESETIPEDPEEFGDFLQRCCFKDFLIAFIKSWDIIKKPAGSSSKKKAAKKKPFEDTAFFSDKTDAYMLQSLQDAEGNDVLTNDPDNGEKSLLYPMKHKLILITGPGGQGKSTFLRNLLKTNDRYRVFDKTVLIPLVALTSIDMDYRDNSFNIIFDYIHHLQPDLRFSGSQKILILLDGFNEYRTSKNRRAVDNITGSLNDLVGNIRAKGDDGNVSLIVTTRDLNTTVKIFPVFRHFQALSLTGTSDSEYRLIRSMCEQQGVAFDNTELEKLTRTPLYARMIKGLIEEGKSMNIEDPFSLFDTVYKARAEQRIGNTAEKSIYPKNDYLYFYYVILPFFAYRIVTSPNLDNTYRFRRDQVHDFLTDLRQNGLDRVMFTYLQENESFRYINGECPQIEVQKLMEFLDNEEDFIINDDSSGEYSFEHEQWRNYLASVFLKNNIQILQAHYRDNNDTIAKAVMCDLNVDADISRMLRQSLNLYGSKNDNANKMKDMFRVDPAFYNHIDGTIRLLHLGFFFCDYLQIDLPIGASGENETIHEILKPMSDYLLANSTNSRLIDRILNNRELVRLVCGIMSKETEYYRRVKDYDKAYQIVELCKRLDNESVFTCQHEAKVYLCYAESIVLNDQILSVPQIFKSAESDEIWKQGTDLLYKVADRNFYLAVNTKGLFLTNPAPYMIRRKIIEQPDFCGVFRHYIRMINDTSYVRRDTSYTIHQALRLLVEYVTVDDDCTFDPYDRNSDPHSLRVKRKTNLFAPLQGEKNLVMANYLLSKCSGQDLAGLNYLRGRIALASSDTKTAQTFFESPLKDEWLLLYHLMLKYCFGNDSFDTEQEFAQLAERIRSDPNGRLDKTHFVYRYIEARETMLSLADDSEKAALKARFEKSERDFGIDQTVKMIMDFLTA